MTSCGSVKVIAPPSIAAIVQTYVNTWSTPMYEFVCKSLYTVDLDELATTWIDNVNALVNSRQQGCSLDAKDACPTRAQVATYMACQNMENPYKQLLEDVLNFYFEIACKGGSRPDKKNLVALLEDVRTFACAYKATTCQATPTTQNNWILIGGIAAAVACLCLLFVFMMMMRRDY